eukprot:scaffold4721_cov134-Skeletonema_menzelii.AAC.4
MGTAEVQVGGRSIAWKPCSLEAFTTLGARAGSFSSEAAAAASFTTLGAGSGSFGSEAAAACFTTLGARAGSFGSEAAAACFTTLGARAGSFGSEAAAGDAFGFGAHRYSLVLESLTQFSIGRAFVGRGHGKNAEEEGESGRDFHCAFVC